MKKIKKVGMLLVIVWCLVLSFAFAACGGKEQLKQLVSEYGITVEGGGFEKGSSLITNLIETAGEKGQEIVALLEEQDYNKDGEMSIFDIFVSKSGSEVQPNGKVKVTLPAPFESENGYVTFHVKDDDSVETLETTYEEGKISFETESFSYFVIAEDEKYYDFCLINVDGRGIVCFEDLELTTKGDALSTGRHAGKELPLAVKDIEDGYAFIGWFGSTDLSNVWDIKYDNLLSAETTFNFTMPANGYVIYAVFRPVREYNTLGVINVGGRGTVSFDGVEASDESDLSFARSEGAESVLVAKETLEGYAFIGWYGTMDTSNVWALKYEVLLSTEKTFTFTMPPYDYIIYAVFKPVHTVYAYADKDTEGTIKWGENNESVSAEVSVAEGKSVALTAVPNEGYKFLGWYDEPKNENEQIGNLLCADATYTVNVVDADVNIYARFEKIQTPDPVKYPLTVGQQGAGGCISINGDTASSLESGVYYENYEAGESITLVAETRSSEYTFKGWFEIDETILTHLVLKDTPVCTQLTYAFTMPENAYTVYAVFEEVTTYWFSAYIDGEGGYFEVDGEDGGKDFYQYGLVSGDRVTVKVVANAGYNFKGWYAATDVPEFISASPEYTFTVGNEDVSVAAVFEAEVTGLILDGANAGFTEGVATYTIGDEYRPNPEYVVVYGATAEGPLYLTKDVDYTIDLGGLNFETAGEYTITYTYLKKSGITETLTVIVAEKA